MTKHQGITCKGSYALGSACGHCGRCKNDPANPTNIFKANSLPELMTAQEAKKKIDAGQTEALQAELKMVIEKINEAIDKGEYSTGGDGHIKPSTKNYLEAKGYKVDFGSQYNESYWSVSWREGGKDKNLDTLKLNMHKAWGR